MSLRDEIAQDLVELYSTDELAVFAQLKDLDGVVFPPIPIHFLSAADVMVFYQVPAESARPQALCRAADAATVKHGWVLTLVASGKDYQVVSVQPNGEGEVMLILSED